MHLYSILIYYCTAVLAFCQSYQHPEVRHCELVITWATIILLIIVGCHLQSTIRSTQYSSPCHVKIKITYFQDRYFLIFSDRLSIRRRVMICSCNAALYSLLAKFCMLYRRYSLHSPKEVHRRPRMAFWTIILHPAVYKSNPMTWMHVVTHFHEQGHPRSKSNFGSPY